MSSESSTGRVTPSAPTCCSVYRRVRVPVVGILNHRHMRGHSRSLWRTLPCMVFTESGSFMKKASCGTSSDGSHSSMKGGGGDGPGDRRGGSGGDGSIGGAGGSEGGSDGGSMLAPAGRRPCARCISSVAPSLKMGPHVSAVRGQ
eukprot:scaffold21329_cov62-Phaeocystis_antarctica.AAC.2